MKTNLLAIVLGLGISTAAFGQTPILSYGFNGTGSTATSSGSDTTGLTLSTGTYAAAQSAGLGVSGAAGDGALNLGTTNVGGMGSLGNGGSAAQTVLDTHLDSLYSFTLTGWFQTASTSKIDGTARLIDASSSNSGFYLAGNAGGLVLAVANGTGTLAPSVNSAAVYAATQTWVYFAVTYTGSSTSNTGTVNFYEGTSAAAATLVSSSTLTFTSGTGEVANPLRVLAIGNLNNATNHPFDGLLDDISVYGTTATDGSGALDLAQIDAIQASALAVPEPTTYGLFGFALLLLGIRAKSRLRVA